MTVLVTGGAGFIGSNLSEALLKRNHDVVVLDNLDPYYDLEIKHHNIDQCRNTAPNNYTFVEGSITNESLVNEIFTNHDIDFVYHEAARAGVRTSVNQPKFYEKNNVQGLLTLLEAAKDNNVTRFVNASSSSVYGRPDYLPYDEDHPNYPKSPYAVTKLAAEHYCKVYTDDLHDLPTVSLRYFTVYGPRMRPNMAISNFVSRALNDEPPIIYGDGEQTRDFTYIDDIVDANRSPPAIPTPQTDERTQRRLHGHHHHQRTRNVRHQRNEHRPRTDPRGPEGRRRETHPRRRLEGPRPTRLRSPDLDQRRRLAFHRLVRRQPGLVRTARPERVIDSVCTIDSARQSFTPTIETPGKQAPLRIPERDSPRGQVVRESNSPVTKRSRRLREGCERVAFARSRNSPIFERPH
ncbi:MAG: GDP-mannose 4,6-dehydratase [Halodesulfurarchaeum sp.]|nr:GDP-mannose 4,6-dehydratase [Halodesulfurarchaeum sp.]